VALAGPAVEEGVHAGPWVGGAGLQRPDGLDSELVKKSPSLGFRRAKPPGNPLGARPLRVRASRL